MPPGQGSYSPHCFVLVMTKCINLPCAYGMCKTLLQLTVKLKKKNPSVIVENAIINNIVSMRGQGIY